MVISFINGPKQEGARPLEALHDTYTPESGRKHDDSGAATSLSFVSRGILGHPSKVEDELSQLAPPTVKKEAECLLSSGPGGSVRHTKGYRFHPQPALGQRPHVPAAVQTPCILGHRIPQTCWGGDICGRKKMTLVLVASRRGQSQHRPLGS